MTTPTFPKLNPLHPKFGAEIIGLDLREEVTPELRAFVEGAMVHYAVVVVRDQIHASDADHVRFSRAFGSLELPPELGMTTAVRRFAPELFDASNLDEYGEIDKPDALKRRFSKGNEAWHTDSSFNPLPTKWSLLLGHLVTQTRGETQFVDTRLGYESLPEPLKDRIAGLQVEHSLAHSRQLGGMQDTSIIQRNMPSVIHPLVRVSPSGRKALYIGAHAQRIVDMPFEESRHLLDELLFHATGPELIYTHRWRQGDLVIWDNRCTMHRATEYDYFNEKRDLRRTTINEYGPDRRATREPQAAPQAG